MGPAFALEHVIVVKFAGFGALVQVAVAAETEEDEVVVVVVTTTTGTAVMEEELPVAPAALEVEAEDAVPVGLAPVARAILDMKLTVGEPPATVVPPDFLR
jgi:hypothetical protein